MKVIPSPIMYHFNDLCLLTIKYFELSFIQGEFLLQFTKDEQQSVATNFWDWAHKVRIKKYKMRTGVEKIFM